MVYNIKKETGLSMFNLPQASIYIFCLQIKSSIKVLRDEHPGKVEGLLNALR